MQPMFVNAGEQSTAVRSPLGSILLGGVVALLAASAGCASTQQITPAGVSDVPRFQEGQVQSQRDAHRAFDERRYADAVQLFTEQRQLGMKQEHKLWFNLGASHWNAGQKSEALEAYEQAAALNPLYLKAHQRLGAHLKSLGSKDPTHQHFKIAAAIQRMDKILARAWDKANAMRAKGAVYFKAVAKLHDTAAEQYDKWGFPEQAEAERKLAILSRQDEERERRQPMEAAQRAQAEADERAFNTELLGTVKDLSATVMKVNPDSPFGSTGMGASGFASSPAKSIGGNSGQMAIAGLGIAEQSMRAYSDILNASEGKLQAQREAVRQQGLQAQAALADPTQAKAQQQAKQRTQQLLQQLDELERLAAEEMGEELAEEGVVFEGDRDTLDP